MRRHWRWAAPAAVVVAGVGAWLVFGYFAFHTILIDEEVDEALPFFTAGPAPSGIPGDETTEEMADAMNEAMATDEMPRVDKVDEPMPEMAATDTPATDGGNDEHAQPDDSDTSETQPSETQPANADTQPAETTETQPSETEPAETEPSETQPASTEPAETGPADTQPADTQPASTERQIIVEASGSFVSRSHPTEGSARVLGDGSGQRFLRLEDFRTDNGPDLNVYLSATSPDAPAGTFDDDFVDLGDLKGNVGSQNYEIPVGLDLDHYSTVAIWCVRFGVVFGAADLAAT